LLFVIFREPGLMVTVGGPGDVDRAVASLDLGGPRPVLMLIGGADRLADDRLAATFTELIAPAVVRHGAAAVDGGTDSGVMRLLGRARAGGPEFPLVGVAARGTVRFPGNEPTVNDAAPLDDNHSHFVLTPGTAWGHEGPYLPLVAAALADGRPTVVVLVDGGEIALDDAARSVRLGLRLLVLGGSGRTADRIAGAVAGSAPDGDERIALLAASEHVRVVSVHDHRAIAGRLDEALGR
jgi:SLOG in TRPM, prokaryote